MFPFKTEVTGGWNALTNIAQGVGRGITTLASGFFPTPQREKVISQTVERADTAGKTYRSVAPQQQSVYETSALSATGWRGSQYAPRFAVPAKRQESKMLAESISPDIPESKPTGLQDIIGWIRGLSESAREVRTIVTDIGLDWGLVDQPTVVGVPRAGYPEGRDEMHQQPTPDNRADIVEMARGVMAGWYEQVKGLFNLGYPQDGAQPAVTIAHELQPSRGTWIGIGIVGAVVLLLILLGKRK